MFTRGIDLSVGGVISLVSALLATHLNAEGGLLIARAPRESSRWPSASARSTALIIACTRSSRSSSRSRPGRSGAASRSAILPVEGGTPSPDADLGRARARCSAFPSRSGPSALLFLLWYWLQADALDHRPDRDRQRRGTCSAARRPRSAGASCRPTRSPRLLAALASHLGDRPDGGRLAERRRSVHPQLDRGGRPRRHEHLRRQGLGGELDRRGDRVPDDPRPRLRAQPARRSGASSSRA